MQRATLNLLCIAGLTLAACQPQPPDNPVPRRRPLGADDTTPNRADPAQPAPSSSDGSAMQKPSQTPTPSVAPAPSRGEPDQAARSPPPEQIEDALAACGRQPAEQQESCRQRIRQAAAAAAGNGTR